jgi:hypothetical protein
MQQKNIRYDHSDGPIFIGGLSFSAKTPLRLMLSSHSNIALSRRTYMWQRFYGRYGDLSQRENFERCLEAMLARKSIQALSPNPERIRREFLLGSPTYGYLFALFHEHFAESVGRRRWGAQIGLIEDYADVIFGDYPTACMIHMVRDPRVRQQKASVKHRQRTGKAGWETAKWLHSAKLAKRNQARYADRYLIVSSEALLADPEPSLRRICDFVGEIYEPSMLTMESAIRFGEENTELTGNTLQQSLSDGMSQRDLAFTQVYARNQILEFGYDLRPVRLSWKEQFLFNIVDRPANLASMFAWRTLQTIRS